MCRLQPEDLDPVRFARLSIANLYDERFSAYTLTIPTTGVTYTARQVSAIWMAMDFLYSCVFILLIGCVGAWACVCLPC
jgi:uncharacterized BrkB/YihY/UPF0761 family membrane protein